MRIGGLCAALALVAAFVATSALAQQPVRVRGTIGNITGPILDVKTREGAMVKVKLAENPTIGTVLKKSLADIKPGEFVGITAMPQPDGTQKAVEIHIFPEAQRGTGEGHRPWDLEANSTMTNANIDSEVAVADGQKLVLKYKDGEKTFIVPANVVVVMFAPATAADLKAGAKIFIVAAKPLPDGTLEAQRLTVGTNGVDPPM